MRAVIFDVDGTLVDSERDGHRVAFNLAFGDLGLPYRWSVEEYGPLLKVTGGRERLTHYLRGEGLDDAHAGELARRLHPLKNEHFLALIAEGRIPARNGVARLLADLEEAGLTVAVATTGSREWVEPLLDRLFGLDRFTVLVAGDDVSKKKPDPQAYELALERLELAPEDAVAIEDSLQGLRAAHAARLPCVVCPSPYARGDDLSDAELLASSFEEVGVEDVRRVAAAGLRAR